MVEYLDDVLDRTFAALADPTRRAIMSRLTAGEATVTELAEPFDLTFAAVSKHLGVLDKAGLVTRTKDGRLRRCRLDAQPLKAASDWIAGYGRFWDSQLASLAEFLEDAVDEGDRP